MSTSDYKSVRVPVIPLDYNSRFLAEKKEILFDYNTGQLYVVSAEDKNVIFNITDVVLEKVREGIDLDNLIINVEGIGDVNLSKYIEYLNKYNLTLLNNDSKQYYAPTVKFDNMSIILRDGEATVAGFKHAGNDTYAVKQDNQIKWVPRTDTGVLDRLNRLEKLAPPDPEEYAKFRTQIENIQLTADLYKTLPAIRRDLDLMTNNYQAIQPTLNKVAEIDTAKSNIESLQSNMTTVTNRVTNLEAKEDYGPKINIIDGRVTTLENKEDYGPKIIDLQSKVSNLMQGPNFGAQITAVDVKVDTLRDAIEVRNNVLDGYIESLREADRVASNERILLANRLNVYDSLDIANKLDDYKTRISSLEAIPNLTNNFGRLEQSVNTITNSYSMLNSKVQGLLSAEDYGPRVAALEGATTKELNQTVYDEDHNIIDGEEVDVDPNCNYIFVTDTRSPIFKISSDSNKTQRIRIILDVTNLNGKSFNINLIRPDGTQLESLVSYKATANNELFMFIIESYDRGVNWYIYEAVQFIGKRETAGGLSPILSQDDNPIRSNITKAPSYVGQLAIVNPNPVIAGSKSSIYYAIGTANVTDWLKIGERPIV